MTEVVEYKAEHGITLIQNQVRDEEAWFRNVTTLADLMAEKEKGYAWTLLKDGEAVACGGFYRYEGNTAEAWYIVSPKAWEERRWLFQIVRNIIDTFLDETGKTLKGHVLVNDRAGRSWAKHMGFTETPGIILDKGQEYTLWERRA